MPSGLVQHPVRHGDRLGERKIHRRRPESVRGAATAPGGTGRYRERFSHPARRHAGDEVQRRPHPPKISGWANRHHPAGRPEQTYAYINVQSAIPPPLPPAYANWERSLSDRLLTVLGNVLTPAEMSAYMPTEAGKNPIDLIDWRLESVQFLTRPNS